MRLGQGVEPAHGRLEQRLLVDLAVDPQAREAAVGKTSSRTWVTGLSAWTWKK